MKTLSPLLVMEKIKNQMELKVGAKELMELLILR